MRFLLTFIIALSLVSCKTEQEIKPGQTWQYIRNHDNPFELSDTITYAVLDVKK